MLEEIRRQEDLLKEADAEMPPESEVETEQFTPGVVEGDTGQTTLFGGEE
jgi:hypothetical protein